MGGTTFGSGTLWHLDVLHALAARLADPGSVDGVLESIRVSLEVELGASAVILCVVEPDRAFLTTLLQSGASETTSEYLRGRLRLQSAVPAATVLADGTPIFWSTIEDRNRRFPTYASFPSACQSWAILPLAAHGQAFGVLSIGWTASRSFDEGDAGLLQVVAQQCALALDRARLGDVEREERDTLELMSEGTRLMVSDLDPAHVVDRLVHLAVPRLAPWCAVYVAEDGCLRRVAVQVADGDRIADQLRGQDAVPIDDATVLGRCFLLGKVELLRNVGHEEVSRIYGEARARQFLAGSPSWTALVVPIRARGEQVGVMSLVSHTWANGPPSGVWHAAEGLAGRAGVALSNARRYRDEKRSAALLAESLRPSGVPEIPGYDVAARFLPAEGRVAGDWFEVAPIPGSSFLVGVGDVGGHGTPAATRMVRLRFAARGLAFAGLGPSSILAGLRELALADPSVGYATTLYGRLQPWSGLFEWASAGHFPPLHLGHDGARWLERADVPPLGVRTTRLSRERRVALSRGEGVVLVTDGVVERRDRPLTEGLDGLRRVLEDRTDDSADELARTVVERFCSAPEDDCCVVVLKRT